MKTSIVISGQISGNHTLLNAIVTHECERKDLMFNNYRLTFATKKAARKALWDGFNYLKRTLDEPNVGSIAGLNYSKFGQLTWDASRAVIE